MVFGVPGGGSCVGPQPLTQKLQFHCFLDGKMQGFERVQKPWFLRSQKGGSGWDPRPGPKTLHFIVLLHRNRKDLSGVRNSCQETVND